MFVVFDIVSIMMNNTEKKQHQLFIVGTGIKFKSHLTVEAQACIKQADKVLYLLNEPAMAAWLKTMNATAESLEDLYLASGLRLEIYRNITKKILATLDDVEKLCVVFYGHPGVFVTSAHDALKQAQAKGHQAVMLPGISAEDCLFADLSIDPASHGCQSFEATDFLLRNLQFDSRCHLILWQIGVIGDVYAKRDTDKTTALQVLIQRLSQHYDPQHSVMLYEAAQYPLFPPQIVKTTLAELPHSKLSAITTLYIPPKKFGKWDQKMLNALHLTESELKKC